MSRHNFLRGSSPGIDALLGVHGDALDELLVGEFLDRIASESAVDFKPLNHGGRGNQLHLGNLLYEAVPGGLVEHDHVGRFLAHLALAPFFLSLLGTTGHGGLGLLLLGLLDDLLSL